MLSEGRVSARVVGSVSVLVLIVLAMTVPPLSGWDVHLKQVPPLHADWHPRFGPGTVPALLIAIAGAFWAIPLAERLSWRRLLLLSFLAGLAWSLALAFVDGRDGIGVVLNGPNEYLRTARSVHDVPAMLHQYVARIPLSAGPRHWPVHLAGHPPGAVLFFIGLVRLGLGSGFAAGMVIALIAATTALAAMITLRVLGAEQAARRAAPFLVLGPAAVWEAVSADAMFASTAAWATVALALAGTRSGWATRIGWSVLAGLLYGYCVLLSYGLPVLALLAVVVLWLARSWWPLPIAAAAALAVLLGFAAEGFDWWQAFPVLRARYWAGVAHMRPGWYWTWGDLAALSFSVGPVLGPVLGEWCAGIREASRRVPVALVGAGVAMVAVADASQMSRAEVERIWLPFVPWLLVGTALLPRRWRAGSLVVQLAVALLVQHLLATNW